MKKLAAILGLAMLLGGVAYAANVTCTVNGTTKMVKSAKACTDIGGTVSAKKM